MKQTAFRLVCTALLLCTVLLALPACASVDFEEAYLPITEISEEDFYVGMLHDDFVLLLQGLENNQDYVKCGRLGDVYFRTKDGMSCVVCFGEEPYQITRIERASITRLATREDFRNLPPVENYRFDYADILPYVGLPGHWELASMMRLYYPLSDGTWCRLFWNGSYDFLTAEEVFGGM